VGTEATGPTPPQRVSRREALRITAVAGLGVALSAATIRELIERAALHRVSATRTQLGTAVTVTGMHPDAVAGRALVDGTFTEVERLEAMLSRYRATSALAALNRDGVVRGAPVELVRVVSRALEFARMTDGAFDPTVAPVLNLYVSRFAAGGLPTDAEVAAMHALVGWRDLHVDGSTIALARPGMAITLDAIAKGFVVDQGVATLTERGADRVIVQASGDMHAAGADNEPWAIAIQDPHDMNGTLGVVDLSGSIASSGDYMQAFTPDRSLNHIIDPRTGRSPRHSSGATVLAPTAMEADAASTAAFVLGPEAGVAFLDRMDGIEGVVVDKQGGRFASKGFGRKLV
jgi:thiamine biosynthesis lipoprotein